MKKIIILLIAVVVLTTASSYYVGYQAEIKINELYAKTAEHPSIQIDIVDYQRGIFSSEAITKITLAKDALSSNDDFSFNVIQNLQHGPILWKTKGLGIGLADSRYQFELSDEVQAELNNLEGLPKDALVALSRLSFDGSSKSTFTIKEFTLKEGETEIQVLAGQLSSSVSSQNQMTADGEWQGMKVIVMDKKMMDLGKLELHSNQTVISGEMFSPMALLEGNISFSFDHLNFAGNSPMESVALEVLSVHSKTIFNQQNLGQFDFVFKADKVKAAGQEFSQLVYDMSIENIDKDSIIALNTLFSEATTDVIGPEKSMVQLQELLPTLLKYKPELKINKIGFITPGGELISTASITIDESAYNEQDISSLMVAINAKADGTAPFAIFENIGMGADIDFMVEQKMLSKDNGMIKLDFMYKSGEVFLNGVAVPMGM